MFLLFANVSQTYVSMAEPLLARLNLSFPTGWTGVVGANGAGKTTVLKLACGLIEPTGGRVQIPGEAVYCAQRTDDVPGSLASLLQSSDHFASELKGQLGLAEDWVERWDSLSHGERKRAQIAAALWQQPAILALDEPTNHIDAEARGMLLRALSNYRGIGLLVSHDRELLDRLCQRCLFVDPPGAVLRPGNYSSGRREAEREEASERTRRETAKKQAARLQAETKRRIQQARDSDRKGSKKGLAPRDHDARARIDLARMTGADGQAGKLARRMQSRLDTARQKVDGIKIRKQYELGIWFEGERCRRDTLFRFPAAAIPLGNDRMLQVPDLTMLPTDRVALTGPNGAGKSTLIRRIVDAIDLPPDRVTYLPQEIDLRSSSRILDEVRLQPPDTLGRIMNVVSRLGSRPARLLESAEPSPGELRKLLLSLGIARQPYLIIMDEPTNHLDLPSIECLEDALDDCPCGLLLVSHDRRFLQRLTRINWHITAEGSNSCRLTVD